jgi:hypothetical protein
VKQPSELEKEFARLCVRYKLPVPCREHAFALDMNRRWRFDFAWPEVKLAVELHGLVVVRAASGAQIVRGCHGTVPGMIRDMDKRNAAILLGWNVLTFCQNHFSGDAAIAMTQRALVAKGWRRIAA